MTFASIQIIGSLEHILSMILSAFAGKSQIMRAFKVFIYR